MKTKTLLLLFAALLAVSCSNDVSIPELQEYCADGVKTKTLTIGSHWVTTNEHNEITDSGTHSTMATLRAMSWGSCVYSTYWELFPTDGKRRSYTVPLKQYDIDSSSGDTLSYTYCTEHSRRTWYHTMPRNIEFIDSSLTLGDSAINVTSSWNGTDTIVRTKIKIADSTVDTTKIFTHAMDTVLVEIYADTTKTELLKTSLYEDGYILKWYEDRVGYNSTMRYEYN